MKKQYIFLLIIMFLLPINVFASGGFGVSPTSLNMYAGETKTISITSNNAVGQLNISSSNGSVASISTSSVFIQTPGSGASFTISSKSVGTAIISVVATSDFATMDEEILTGQTKKITVNVIAKPAQSLTPSPTPSPKPPVNNKSTNASLKEISVDGYNIQKIDNNNYKLTVSNNINSINIKAIAADSKSKVSGTGSHELKVNENKFEVIVTSEAGNTNKINLVITRKDGFYIDDLPKIIGDKSIKNTNIIIDKDSKLTSSDLLSIKKSKKTLKFNHYDENKILKYTWTIDGSKIKDDKEIELFISNISSYTKNIAKLSNYADGININFKHSGDLPKGTKIKIFVGDKYNNNDLINVYYYNKEKEELEKVKEKLRVKDGYVEFELEHCSEYFITLSNLVSEKQEIKVSNPFIAISIIELIIIVIGIIIYYTKIRLVLNKKTI